MGTGHFFAQSGRTTCGRTACTVLVAVAVTGCTMLSRLSRVGEAPEVSHIENPVVQPDYQPVTMPMPAPEPPVQNANSLWRSGAKAFFEDTRASNVGDLVTVLITIQDDASINGTTSRGRESDESFGLEGTAGTALSGDILPDRLLGNSGESGNLLSLDNSSSTDGSGTTTRRENVNLKVSAVVTQVLPNGNMVVEGKQEVRVNYEMRRLGIRGIIRKEDITTSNTISFDQIAEGRVVYGGEGQISDLQQPRYGNQVLDIILPF